MIMANLLLVTSGVSSVYHSLVNTQLGVKRFVSPDQNASLVIGNSMITTTDGHTIEIKGGSFYGPTGMVQIHAGVKRWILVDGIEWYSQNYRNDIMAYEAVADAAYLTLAEWIEYCGDDIELWKPEDITIGVDNVRTAEESQEYLKTIPAFKHLFEPI